MNVGKPEIAALKPVGEPLVVNAKQVKDRRLEVMDVNRISDDVHAEIVSFAMSDARLYPAASQPGGEGVRMMIPSPALAIIEVPLDERGAAEFAAPDHERIVK